MTITHNISNGGVAAGASSITVSIVYTAGTNDALFIGYGHRENGGPRTVSDVTWNGVTVDTPEIIEQAVGDNLNLLALEVAPTTGTHDLVVSISSSADRLGLRGSILSGVNQVSPYDGEVKSSGTSKAPARNVVSAAGDWTVGVMHIDKHSGHPVVTALSHTDRDTDDDHNSAGAYSIQTGAEGDSSVDMTWTLTADENLPWEVCACNVNVAPTTPNMDAVKFRLFKAPI